MGYLIAGLVTIVAVPSLSVVLLLFGMGLWVKGISHSELEDEDA